MCKQLSAELVQKFIFSNIHLANKQGKYEEKKLYLYVLLRNLHQIYVKIFGVEMKFNDKNCTKKNCKRMRKIESKMK